MAATFDEVEHLVARHFLEVADAAFAVDAALSVAGDQLAQGVMLLRLPFVELEAGQSVAVLVTSVLQHAGVALVTVSAITREVYQRTLQHVDLGSADRC